MNSPMLTTYEFQWWLDRLCQLPMNSYGRKDRMCQSLVGSLGVAPTMPTTYAFPDATGSSQAGMFAAGQERWDTAAHIHHHC
mmetsp:Transcript_29059/g.56857  ORF Transcript_29059/g.56857 Transcript_29059/m.56857 type:complete len:82 (+) Transcript_29059:1894-2139(+)